MDKQNSVVSSVDRSRSSAFKKPGNFLSDVQSELQRVEWPSRPVVLRSFLLVLLVMFVFVIFVGGIDILLGKIFYALKLLR